ncbi:hypothetical protein [Tropicibacter oceani]|uniref:Polysaccharide biosynthesis enzyme WcbI domain-containing protein n=1 Tax=Tropicibacter oceani TaxID=3058420 RepID=A0ABY8QIH1_9RHOB|nr:hypothetical protein [Tropicibacter oceani]WGW04429.1 hypothetical protein QF118_02470 [Tropicibacter oceani]
MAEPRIARLYLYPDLRRRVQAGKPGFVTTLCAVLRAQGFEVCLNGDTPEDLRAAKGHPGYAIVRMTDPPTERGVTFRRTYFAPFWHIERSAARWDWPVAQARFDPRGVKPHKAARLLANLRARHFPGVTPGRDGHVLIALQGRLLERRGFQSCTPLQMIEAVLEHDQTRHIHATLHPRETYTAHEMQALEALTRRFARLTVGMGGSDRVLPGCDYVVTQNSAVAFAGYLLEKPAALFGQIDFHHIAANVHTLGAEQALHSVPDMRPDFAAYLWWFLRDHAIDDSRPDAQARITQALIRAGWPLD